MKPDFAEKMAGNMAKDSFPPKKDAAPVESDGGPLGELGEPKGADGAILSKLEKELGLSPEDAQKAFDICTGGGESPDSMSMDDSGGM